MRILAGQFKYRAIEQPRSSVVRPMSQKARAAIFDVLGDIEGMSVLDLYAGSGAVGLEAISRGANQVTFIEENAQVASVIRRNVQKLDVSTATIVNKSVELWFKEAKKVTFNIILADPPYAQFNSSFFERATGILAESGIMVLSHASKIPAPELKSLQLVQHKSYGDSALSFYKR